MRVLKKFQISNFKFQNKGGFTLTEVVIVLALLGVLLIGILPLFLDSIAANKANFLYSNAYKVVDSKIEEQRNLDFDSITSQNFSVPELPSGQGVLSVTNNIDGTAQTDIKKVNVKVTWFFNRSREIEIETYIARNGLKR